MSFSAQKKSKQEIWETEGDGLDVAPDLDLVFVLVLVSVFFRDAHPPARVLPHLDKVGRSGQNKGGRRKEHFY